jgi:hypothetical protein
VLQITWRCSDQQMKFKKYIIPHGVFHTLYADTTVLLSRMIRYNVAQHCSAHKCSDISLFQNNLCQALDDFSFREPVVRIKLICSRHLSEFYFQNKIFVTINTTKEQHCLAIVCTEKCNLCLPFLWYHQTFLYYSLCYL